MAEQFVSRQGLLVPAGSLSAEADPIMARQADLAAQRAATTVEHSDELARTAETARHTAALADLGEWRKAETRARNERARDAREATRLAELYRTAARSGARARIRTQIRGSAEMRALRVARVRTVTLLAGLPILSAFAAWSTTGVQAGVVRLLDLQAGTAAWTASWVMEPALIAIVALIIIGRSVLASSGGTVDGRATAVEWTALGLSLALNILGGWPEAGGWSWAGVGAGLATALPHSIGPIGAAGTAFLIGLFDGYVTAARPWDDAPRLADMDLTPPAPPAIHVPNTITNPTAVPAPGTGAPQPDAGTAPAGTGTGHAPAVPAPGTATTGTAATSTAGTDLVPIRKPRSTGTARRRPRTLPASTAAGTGTGSARQAARQYWEAEVAAGRRPTGMDLARAANRQDDDTGVFRRWARAWATELADQPTSGGGPGGR